MPIHNHSILVGKSLIWSSSLSETVFFFWPWHQISSSRDVNAIRWPPSLPLLMTSLLLSFSANTLCLYMQSFNAVGSHLDLVCYWPLASKWPALILFDNLYAPPTTPSIAALLALKPFRCSLLLLFLLHFVKQNPVVIRNLVVDDPFHCSSPFSICLWITFSILCCMFAAIIEYSNAQVDLFKPHRMIFAGNRQSWW